MPTEIYARHGDLVIEKFPLNTHSGDLDRATDYVVAGSHSSPHTIRGVCLQRRDGEQIRVRIPEDTQLVHADRHTVIPLPAGDYTIGPLRERGGEGDRAVED